MSRYEYKINEVNAISVWDTENPNENGAPFLFQPDWPNTTPWASKEQAEEWVGVFIESLENPESEFVPGESPDNHPKPRLEPVEDTPNEVIEGEIE
jgi:hypothetical protein